MNPLMVTVNQLKSKKMVSTLSVKIKLNEIKLILCTVI